MKLHVGSFTTKVLQRPESTDVYGRMVRVDPLRYEIVAVFTNLTPEQADRLTDILRADDPIEIIRDNS